jgi:predicted nucleic acid-binding protein
MTVVDASVLIAHLDAGDAQHQEAGALLTEAAGEPLVASVVTLAEVLVGPARRGQAARAQRALARHGVDEIALGGDAAVRLAQLRAETGLRLPDCCVLLAAEQTEQGVATLDDRLRRAADARGIPSRSPGGPPAISD